jgi:hypothetical protein
MGTKNVTVFKPVNGVVKKNAHLPTSEFGDQNIKPIFFLIKNKTQINININNIHINDNRHLHVSWWYHILYVQGVHVWTNDIFR